jgi:hypothetical protein
MIKINITKFVYRKNYSVQLIRYADSLIFHKKHMSLIQISRAVYFYRLKNVTFAPPGIMTFDHTPATKTYAQKMM